MTVATQTTETPKTPANAKVPATKPVAAKPQPKPARPQGRVGQAVSRMRTGVGDTIGELRKVAWPDSDMTRNLTLVVIGISAAIGVLLGVVDAGLTALYQLLEQVGR